MADTCTGPSCGAQQSSPLSDPSTWLMGALFTVVASLPLIVVFILPRVLAVVGRVLGWMLRKKTEGRRAQLMALMEEDNKSHKNTSKSSASGKETDRAEAVDGAAKSDREWNGMIGFFHPFCNAGGGGERVLWAAIRATQNQYPNAKCIVYTGDHDVTKSDILSRVKSRFNIPLHAPTITFLYLSKRHWVQASTWPHFTLLGQSLGSMILAWDAFSLLVPDMFVDTMGYAFALGLCKFLFSGVPTGAYVHYPTISTDMLDSLDPASASGSQGVNAGKGTGAKGSAKKAYWKLFAKLYCWVGSSVDVVMTNSTWTQGHIKSLWGPLRTVKDKSHPIAVVYPPVAVKELEEIIEVSEASEKKRQPILVYIAQFRPEKNHQLIVESFAEFLKTNTEAARDAQLVLIGSVRDDQDSKRVYQLRLLVNELGLKDSVVFHLDAPWPDILNWLQKASVGVNGMWNEHFGIGVVEYQAAGLISVVHKSGGPMIDIVVEVDGQPTGKFRNRPSFATLSLDITNRNLPPGYHASTPKEFAEGYEKALSTANPVAMRKRAQRSAQRFTEEEFAKLWLVEMERLVRLAR